MKKYFYLALCVAFVGCKSNTTTESITTESQIDSVSLFVAQIDSISELIKLDSLNATFYFDRAALYMKTQSLGPGISDLQYAVQLDSTKAEYWAKLGVLNYAMQQTRNAKDCWERCSNLDGRNLDCRLNLAEMYLAVGELKKGQRRLNEILDFDPQNSSALFLTGNYALMENDTVKAMKYIQAAINEDQSLFRAYDQMGVLYSSKGDLLALDYFNYGSFYKSEFILIFRSKKDENNDYSNTINSYSKTASLIHVEQSGDGDTVKLNFDIVLNKGIEPEQLVRDLAKNPNIFDVSLVASKHDVDY